MFLTTDDTTTEIFKRKVAVKQIRTDHFNMVDKEVTILLQADKQQNIVLYFVVVMFIY